MSGVQVKRKKTGMTPNLGMTDYITHILPRYHISRQNLGWEDKYFLNMYVELARLTFAISSRILRFRTVIRLLESKFCPGMSMSSAYLSSSSSSLLWSFSWKRKREGKKFLRKKEQHLVLVFPLTKPLLTVFFKPIIIMNYILLLILAIRTLKISCISR